jgi:hypothetical protein
MGLTTDAGHVSRRSDRRHSEEGRTTLFSFGYWGAGSATRALVDAVNDAEALRGFEPPLWADIRISRSVRAVGFRDHAFERLLGANYVWMPDLGNVCVREHRGGIEIKNPAAVEDLLDHALSAPRRRVIFFCACPAPISCHRRAVAMLTKEAARRRGSNVDVVEWPGGEPGAMTIEVSDVIRRSVARAGQTTLAFRDSMSAGVAASLPWGTSVTLKAGKSQSSVLVGPARFTARGAHLRVLVFNPASNSAAAFRKEWGYDYVA